MHNNNTSAKYDICAARITVFCCPALGILFFDPIQLTSNDIVEDATPEQQATQATTVVGPREPVYKASLRSASLQKSCTSSGKKAKWASRSQTLKVRKHRCTPAARLVLRVCPCRPALCALPGQMHEVRLLLAEPVALHVRLTCAERLALVISLCTTIVATWSMVRCKTAPTATHQWDLVQSAKPNCRSARRC
eukprot:CAMPEP_0174711904 /NCGR_PEP_ID=MMETSP1094-20130205/13083_1 /TAXON_ID=156173 /ORGANISM="Chrysochromulina brevifilum, Strain UTEX LB 985" /LENGTH=192 /DNA_ID=CAMNT_0015910911 /DNA_START=55 /DNA_END=630 /DNA_ORIENTATION=-